MVWSAAMNAQTRSAPGLLARLRSDEPTIAVELRPPRVDLAHGESMDVWMALHSTVRRLLAREVPLFVTDGAVGTAEEENLHHLVTNLDQALARDLVCPFLTTKHTLEYCHWYAARASDAGATALTVLGGDRGVGAPRCVPHGYLLRQQLRERFPELALGGWANPHRDPAHQAALLAGDDLFADFFLTQLVSHHDMPAVEAFRAELDRLGVELPGVYGVFYYRTPNPRTLRRLAEFFPVPVEAIEADFAAGATAAQVCARSILALRERGIDHVYVSNLSPESAPQQLARIRQAVDAG